MKIRENEDEPSSCDVTGVAIFASFPETVLIYIFCSNIIINSAPFHSKFLPVKMINYVVTLSIIQVETDVKSLKITMIKSLRLIIIG